jgi:hypothetical protein
VGGDEAEGGSNHAYALGAAAKAGAKSSRGHTPLARSLSQNARQIIQADAKPGSKGADGRAYDHNEKASSTRAESKDDGPVLLSLADVDAGATDEGKVAELLRRLIAENRRLSPKWNQERQRNYDGEDDRL